jgi:SAM-dependent methyltransferase|tara:strand:+ start:1881 stop:3161 length:1281 start_codon:yes stop_codon:yes gene_type:complete
MKSSADYFEREDCRMCLSKDLSLAVTLTASPPGNNFIKNDESEIEEQEFPLQLKFCNQCFHVQLAHIVDPKFLFQNNYSYVSSTSAVFVKHLADYSNHVTDFLGLSNDSFVVDIGSNDGACLKGFKKKGMSVLGVDPAREVADIAIKNGIETIADFFSLDIAKMITKNYGKADLVTSHNACAHIDDLDQIINGVRELMRYDGVFIMEVGYFLDVFKNKWFDTIYHEHLDFHTVAPLKRLFERFGMEIFRVERISPQGGSIRVFSQNKKGKYEIESSVDNLIKLEEEEGLQDISSLENFDKEINIIGQKFKKLLSEQKSQGASIAAYGAPTKATTLCYHFGIGPEFIDFIVDDNPLKQGMLSPGKHIPVLSSEQIYEQKPDFVVILAWNFAESIISNHEKYLMEGGKFILPMPEPRIISNNTIGNPL